MQNEKPNTPQGWDNLWVLMHSEEGKKLINVFSSMAEKNVTHNKFIEKMNAIFNFLGIFLILGFLVYINHTGAIDNCTFGSLVGTVVGYYLKSRFQ